MRRFRLSASAVSRLVVLSGVTAGVAGSYIQWGLGVALLLLAVALVLYGLLLIDVKG